MMRKVNTIKVGDGETNVQIFEMTISEMRAFFERRDAEVENDEQAFDFLGELLFEDCSLQDIQLLTDLDAAACEELSQRDLTNLRQAIRSANPAFFRSREKLAALAQNVMDQESRQTTDRAQ